VIFNSGNWREFGLYITRLPKQLFSGIRGMQNKPGMVIALASEASALLGRMKWRNENGGQKSIVQLPGACELKVALAGVGTRNAESAAADLISQGVTSMISAGIAGGLDPKLKAADIVIATDVLQLDPTGIGGPWPAETKAVALADAQLSRNNLRTHSGTILTAETGALTCSDKASLFRQSGALTVDMESAAVARMAAQANLPFFGLRAVCDPAGQSVPEQLYACLNPDGSIRLPTVMYSILLRPGLLKPMLGMGLAFSSARRALRKAWQVLINNGLAQTLVKP
jgi:adenosylhomocysteine nucleosidase